MKVRKVDEPNRARGRLAMDADDVKRALLCDIRNLNDGVWGLSLMRLIGCNGGHGIGVRFSNSDICSDYKYESPSRTVVEGFTEIFETGLHLLLDYIHLNKKPCDKTNRQILDKLITFMTNIKKAEESLSCQNTVKESEWMARVTVHYLSALSVFEDICLDKYTKERKDHCPCPCHHPLTYTDTNIGNPRTWYGKLDAVLGSSEDSSYKEDGGSPVAVSVACDISTERSGESENSSIVDSSSSSHDYLSQADIKVTPLRAQLSQVQSQAIVFSFYQKKHHPNLNMIPTLGVSRTHIQFHFYDSEKDIYLMSSEMPLFLNDKTSLLSRTVLATWLVVNYKHLMTGATEVMEKEPKFGLHESFGPVTLDLYKNGIEITPIEPVKLEDPKAVGYAIQKRSPLSNLLIEKYSKKLKV